MADTDRRTVKPADPDAYIPDPDHGGKLVADGRDVVWSPYWQGHLDRGNVVEVEADTPAAAPAPAVVPAAPPVAPAAPVRPAAQPAPAAAKPAA